MLRAFKGQHYAAGPDQPSPALRGRTPRQAGRSATRRRAAEILLKEIEHRENRPGAPVDFDVAALRRELGLGG